MITIRLLILFLLFSLSYPVLSSQPVDESCDPLISKSISSANKNFVVRIVNQLPLYRLTVSTSSMSTTTIHKKSPRSLTKSMNALSETSFESIDNKPYVFGSFGLMNLDLESDRCNSCLLKVTIDTRKAHNSFEGNIDKELIKNLLNTNEAAFINFFILYHNLSPFHGDMIKQLPHLQQLWQTNIYEARIKYLNNVCNIFDQYNLSPRTKHVDSPGENPIQKLLSSKALPQRTNFRTNKISLSDPVDLVAICDRRRLYNAFCPISTAKLKQIIQNASDYRMACDEFILKLNLAEPFARLYYTDQLGFKYNVYNKRSFDQLFDHFKCYQIMEFFNDSDTTHDYVHQFFNQERRHGHNSSLDRKIEILREHALNAIELRNQMSCDFADNIKYLNLVNNYETCLRNIDHNLEKIYHDFTATKQ